MLRSRFLWRIYGGQLVLLLATALAVAWVVSGGDVPWAGLFVTVLVLAVLALALSILTVRGWYRRLSTMRSLALGIQAGERGRRFPVGDPDGLGELGRVFNDLSDELEAKVDTITSDRNQLLTILGGMVEGVVAVDDRERILHLNGVASRILEVSPVESLCRPLWEVARIPELSEAVSKTLEEDRAVSVEVRLVRRTQDQLLELMSAPLRHEGGRPAGAVVVFHDVTRLRRLESVRRDFVANVSHELKTPVTAIRSVAETLIGDAEMPLETRERFLGKIHGQALRLSELVSDLLVLARVEADEDPQRLLLDLSEVILTSIEARVSESEPRRVEADLPRHPVVVRGDPEALRQVLDNLLDNALKYTPPEGRVALRLRCESGSAELEVQDSGVGIEPRHQARIFERFYRVDEGRAREVGGTGLGLAIVKHICVAHGGEVDLHSLPGRGSTFRVRLPLSDEPLPEA